MIKWKDWRKDWQVRGRSGSAAVEFAIVVPIFLIVLFGIIQFGAVLFLHNNMANAARETTRRMAVAEMNASEAEAYAANYLANWGLTFTVLATEPAAGVSNGDVSVQITVPAADAVLVNFPINWPGTLMAQATMRRES
ncbi:MAG: TadE/TadG family type IV pilus assembly protein [Kiloniellales bacterium]